MSAVIRNYEKEFATDVMENHHVFYDLYIKSDDPQALRNQIAEELTDLDFKILLNELTKFEDEELDEVFRGGNAKPLRAVIKAAKDNKKGSKYPLLWKFFLILGIALLFVFLAYSRSAIYSSIYGTVTKFSEQPSSLLFYSFVVSILLSFIFWAIKYVVPIYAWVKIIGIYDPTESTANVRIVLAGDCQFKDKDSYGKLENDMSELYSALSRRYANKLDKRTLSNNVASDLSLTGQTQSIMNKLRATEDELSQLERNFAAGKISESSYNDLKNKLEMKKTQIETLFDLLSP
ncbi:MAG: hypothetical protein RAK22_02265 [Nanoarchaeota archaeon]|nr:hypothetical protein [Nanoarchaeota archaeon]